MVVSGSLRILFVGLLGVLGLVTGCATESLGIDQVQAGGQRVTLVSDLVCVKFDGCAAPLLQVASGSVVETALPVEVGFSVGSVPSAAWGVDAGSGGRRVLTSGVEPGRYLMFLTTVSGVKLLRLELS